MFPKISYYYCNLSGKANRTEYGVYLFLDTVAIFSASYFVQKINYNNEQIMNLFYVYLILNLIFVPMNAVSSRRLRHIGINTVMVFLNVIPVVNIVFRLYLLIKRGKVNDRF